MNHIFKGPVVILCRIVLGGVFIYASIDKIMHPEEFAKAIKANKDKYPKP